MELNGNFWNVQCAYKHLKRVVRNSYKLLEPTDAWVRTCNTEFWVHQNRWNPEIEKIKKKHIESVPKQPPQSSVSISRQERFFWENYFLRLSYTGTAMYWCPQDSCDSRLNGENCVKREQENEIFGKNSDFSPKYPKKKFIKKKSTHEKNLEKLKVAGKHF